MKSVTGFEYDSSITVLLISNFDGIFSLSLIPSSFSLSMYTGGMTM